MNSNKVLPLTPRALYEYACAHKLEDCRIRLCDSAAISFFPTTDSVGRSKNKIIIDVSDLYPVEFDELSADDRSIVYRVDGVDITAVMPQLD